LPRHRILERTDKPRNGVRSSTWCRCLRRTGQPVQPVSEKTPSPRCNGMRLVTRDPSRICTYFPRVRLVTPSNRLETAPKRPLRHGSPRCPVPLAFIVRRVVRDAPTIVVVAAHALTAAREGQERQGEQKKFHFHRSSVPAGHRSFLVAGSTVICRSERGNHKQPPRPEFQERSVTVHRQPGHLVPLATDWLSSKPLSPSRLRTICSLLYKKLGRT
jgi:hypothetical protein